MVFIAPDDKINEYLAKALFFHIAVFILAYGINLFFDMNIFNQKKTHEIEIIQEAVRVDIVGLPKHTLQELKKMNLNRTPKLEEKKEDTKTNETSKVEFKKKAKKVNLSNLLNNLSQKKVVVKKRTKKKNKVNQEALNKLILEGNEVSKGSSTFGEVAKKAELEFVKYIQSLPDKIRPFWKLPSYLLNKKLKCRVRAFVASNGKILRTEIFESSGDEEFDKKAQEAVLKASPLPRPSSEILTEVSSGKVILGFPL